jgi:cell surface protein SprA
MTNNVTYSFKSTYQPFKELRIDFGGQQSQTHINSEYYYTENNSVNTDNRKESGTYTINIWMLNSAFNTKPDSANQVSEAFEQYKTNLSVIAWRLAREREHNYPDNYQPTADSLNMPTGYSSQNPEVAIPAFLAAYGGYSTSTKNLSFTNWLYLRPTWRIKYDGLTNIDFLAKYFKTISLSHGYTALFSVGSFSSTLNWDYFNLSDTSSLFQPKYDISSFTASEQFIPLFGIDVTWKNNMLTKFEYKKTRNLTMSLSNNQMAEVYTWEYTIGTGYRFDKLKLKIKTPGGATKPLKSDLNVRGDISIRDNLTMIHDLNQGTNQVTQGQKVITTKITADYQLSEKLMLTAYYDRLVTTPKVGSFKQSVTEFGFKFQFTL